MESAPTGFLGRVKVPFVVPDKIFGLTLILDFIDHGTRLCPALSATGSAGQRGRPYIEEKCIYALRMNKNTEIVNIYGKIVYIFRKNTEYGVDSYGFRVYNAFHKY